MSEQSLRLRRQVLNLETRRFPSRSDLLATIFTNAPNAYSSRFKFEGPIFRVIDDDAIASYSTEAARLNQQVAREAATMLNQINWGGVDPTTPEYWEKYINEFPSRRLVVGSLR